MTLIIDNLTYFFIFLIAASFLVLRLAFIGKFFRVINTLIHETGHSIMALITDGEVLKVELFSDTSGTTITKSKSKFGQFMIAFAAYPFASVSAFLFVFLLSKNLFNELLLFLSVIALLNLIFYVRNRHGIIWILSFLCIIFINFRFGNIFSSFVFATIITAITLLESFWSVLVLVYLSFIKSKAAGDATNLAHISHVPACIWSLIFLLISSFLFFKSVIIYWHYDFTALQKCLI